MLTLFFLYRNIVLWSGETNWLLFIRNFEIHAINYIPIIICKSRKWISKQKFVKVAHKSNDIILMQTHTKTYFIEEQRMERNAIKRSLWFCRNPLITGTSFKSVDINHRKFGEALSCNLNMYGGRQSQAFGTMLGIEDYLDLSIKHEVNQRIWLHI